MKISIIGLRWLGLPLAKSLQNSGNSIFGTTTSFYKKEKIDTRIKVTLFDFTENQTLDQEIIINCDLAIITVPPFIKMPNDSYGNYLLEVVEQFSSKTKFIFTSSTSVYPKESGFYNEDSKTIEDSPVMIAENKLKKHLNKKLTILRLGGLYGINRHPIYHLQGKDNINNPYGTINFIHIADIIEVIQLTIRQKVYGNTFNVVHHAHPTRVEYYHELVKQLNLKSISFKEETAKTKPRIIDSSKILNELNLEFRRSLYPPFQ
ncbi:MAG: hypothetical protein MK105_05820 [Crocinitomicaceae bacterium]|nr:hypothetical protein [Crocinitomicaceae bacterium]